jgi:hypothetical protein
VENQFDFEAERICRMMVKGLFSRVNLSKVTVSLQVLLLVASGICCKVHGDGPPLLTGSTWEIGFEYNYLEYEEREGGRKFMEEEGSLFGLGTAWTSHHPSGLMLRVATGFVGGELDYDGQTQSGVPLTADTEDFIWKIRGLIGYDYDLPDFVLTPYTGIGYRYWNDDIGGPGGYEREVEYLYTPIGIETAAPLGDEWIWGVRGEYDLFWGGEVKAHFSDVHGGLNNPTVDQDDGYGARGAVYLKRRLRNVSLGLEIFIRYWDIDRSDEDIVTLYGAPIGVSWEPKNETTVTGFQISLLF